MKKMNKSMCAHEARRANFAAFCTGTCRVIDLGEVLLADQAAIVLDAYKQGPTI